MRRFVTLNCLVDRIDAEPFPSDAVQNLRQSVLLPVVYKPILQQALQNVNFRFHRTCSFYNIIRECNVSEGETLLMFWGWAEGTRSESKVNVSMSASSSSTAFGGCQTPRTAAELRHTAQQTDISCRYTPGVASPGSIPFSSPASSMLQPAGRSMSILGSVCALLLNKPNASNPKEVVSITGSACSDNICRICFGGESSERLVRPCSCRGTIAAVHRTCLERWLLQASSSYCELCRHHYVVTRSHKWSWVRSLCEWAVSGRGRALALDAWRGAALGACSVLGTARALHACDAVLQAGARRGGGAAFAANLFSSLLIGIIGALNGLLTTWMLLKIQEHQASWQAWRDSTLHVRVRLAGDTPRGSSATLVGAPGAPPPARQHRSTNVADPFMRPKKMCMSQAFMLVVLTTCTICFVMASYVLALQLLRNDLVYYPLVQPSVLHFNTFTTSPISHTTVTPSPTARLPITPSPTARLPITPSPTAHALTQTIMN